ncbi:MAG: RNA 2'-phosphotransferase [Lewinella sp.]|nr:RNA 2'-phosphotransferase [Lewinella sp.]
MGPDYLESLSKFLSLVLRHKPEVVGIELDEEGWADVDALIEGAVDKGKELDRSILEAIVKHDEKQRYSFSPDKNKIRANQGHSVQVDLGLEPVEPPKFLYYGTEERFVERIMFQGLRPGNRNHVELAETLEEAEASNDSPDAIVFRVRARRMHEAGLSFYQSSNGVWLAEKVPAKYLDMY